ncbi:hypothetical protein GBAR_LOCUS19607 [Geodia barretti]|nr:hypothetical protein GBAR_LOCUS19607 [Geodia barretti]
MGTLLDVRQETMPATSAHVFSVSTLLGLDTPEVHVFGRAIAGHLLLPPGHDLTLALGLKKPSPHILPHLLPLLEDYKLWESPSLPTPSADSHMTGNTGL